MRRVLEASSGLRLPNGFHMERVQWLYDGLATSLTVPRPTSESFDGRPPPKHLVYWMQTSVRSKYNYSLEYAIAVANALSLPLHVVYFLSDRSVVPPSYQPRDPNAFGFATERHAKFGLEGLACVQKKLAKRGLSFEVFHHRHVVSPSDKPIEFWTDVDEASEEDPPSTLKPSRSMLLDRCARNAAAVITDRPYLRPWREALAQCVSDAKAQRREWGVVQVEGDVVVPCESASYKEEYAARTIRPKIQAQLKKFLVELDHQEVKEECKTVGKSIVTSAFQDDTVLVPLDVTDTDKALQLLDVDRTVRGVSCFLGGEDVAVETGKTFLEKKLVRYATDRNEPSGDGGSNLSIYLRYGHISPVRIALNAQKVKNAKEGKDSFLEELIVRRELSVNMGVFNASYDTMACLPDYAAKTLQDHAGDKREHLYTVEQLEAAKTFDVYWNAAQLEMVYTGAMHGYMRMYWAKKVLEWTKTPELGFRIGLYLNNKYALDAPDPNSYTGIAWSFGKHDQGWKERPIFGKVRYMNESGLKRKFRMDAYVNKVKKLQSGDKDSNAGILDLPKQIKSPAKPRKTKKLVEDEGDSPVSASSPTPKKRKTLDNFFSKK
ncbi:hypothetical protein Poli38472_008595 [Pythium oligandrum]|uniref:Deoxyribodipyrimidine photo-lyase n=1 Tax=Pythium oligandrum TaxID=41045 RepID=A0A8K1C4F8_PYTOL|nr:hypothetical protein Poli38472_008595 [Pythium oligandrum]|eukprot:TMW55947.1 hypothetical protein Poli38472_008595 [Pythium oligandrum]